jgi:hypothetical protein
MVYNSSSMLRSETTKLDTVNPILKDTPIEQITVYKGQSHFPH